MIAVLWILAGVALVACVGVLATRILVGRIEAAHPRRGLLLDVGGRRMHAIDVPAAAGRPSAGDGSQTTLDEPRTLVVLHGTVSSALDAHAALAATLRRFGRVVFVDRPGHGYSTRDRTRDTTLAGQAEAVVGVMDRLGIAEAIVVGHSFGGAVAAAMAVLRPDHVAGLVLIAPATHPWPGRVALSYRLFGSPLVGRLLAPVVTTPLGLLLLDSGLAGVFLPEAPPPDYRRRSGVALSMRPDAFRASAEEIGALSGELAALAPRYGEIRVPTVVLAADGDRVVSNEIHARAFVAAVPGSRLVALEGAGHVVHHNRPEVVAEAVAWVIARMSKPTPAAARASDASRM